MTELTSLPGGLPEAKTPITVEGDSIVTTGTETAQILISPDLIISTANRTIDNLYSECVILHEKFGIESDDELRQILAGLSQFRSGFRSLLDRALDTVIKEKQ